MTLIDLDLVRAKAQLRLGNITIVSTKDLALIQYHEWMNKILADIRWASEQVKSYKDGV
jgi:hypothetical protein